ncbi:MAG: hypothetical protein H7256_16395 [Bdellovibrio sp.]|nr:hypothetical protein [Bdellovibrio sp.]
MNQQACFFVEDMQQLKEFSASHTSQLLDFGNKFRSFVFILKNHYRDLNEFEQSVNENTVLPLNEVLTQFLTYSKEFDAPIADPLIVHDTTLYWIHDIDTFVGLPKSIQPKLSNLGPHIYFYENFTFLDKLR